MCVDPNARRLLVLFSSVKLIMFLYEQAAAGYSDGLLMADFTKSTRSVKRDSNEPARGAKQ